MKRNKFFARIQILLIAMLLLSACSALPNASQKTATPQASGVETKKIVAEGRLIPNQSLKLSFASGGRVQELLIAEGSDVQAGQVIARLSGAEQVQTAIQAAQYNLLAARQQIDALNENYSSVMASAQLALAQAKLDLKDAEDKRASMIYRRASDSTLNAFQADLILMQEKLDRAQDFLDHLGDGGDKLVRAQALMDVSNALKARDRAQYNLNYASELPIQSEIDKAEANVMTARAKVETARLQLNRLSSGPDLNALALAQASQQKAETDLKARQVDLSNLELKAPFSGKAVDLGIQAGEQVNPGQTVATLVDFSRWLVETKDLTEIKVADVKVGQAVTLVPDALPGVTLNGTVERISNVYTENQGDVTYTVRIGLTQSDERLRWGMTVGIQFGSGGTNPAVSQPTLAPTATIGVTATPAADAAGSAEKTAAAYFDALAKGDVPAAVSLLSNYSLVAEKITRDAASAALQAGIAGGAKWSGLEVKESKAQDASTTLVHVVYKLDSKDAKTGTVSQKQQDEWWPVRLENGTWLYNWNHVIDFRAYDLDSQTTNGLSADPLQITRYADHMSLTLFVQNRTNDPIVLGQTNEILATFHFGDKKVEAEKAQLVFEHLQTYPDVRVQVKGLVDSYPDKVDIRTWKDYQVPPWFTFMFHN